MLRLNQNQKLILQQSSFAGYEDGIHFNVNWDLLTETGVFRLAYLHFSILANHFHRFHGIDIFIWRIWIMFKYVYAMKHIYSFYVVFCQLRLACQSLNGTVIARLFFSPYPVSYPILIISKHLFYFMYSCLPWFYVILVLMVIPIQTV